MTLRVPAEFHGEGEQQLYSYSQVVDLQSRLMLVAGMAEKGKEDVDTFVEVRTSLSTRYCTTFRFFRLVDIIIDIVIFHCTSELRYGNMRYRSISELCHR